MSLAGLCFMMSRKIGILQVTAAFSVVQILSVVQGNLLYPELRSDLQEYQDIGSCYPDIGEWQIMHRNYYEDRYFGKTDKCVKFSTYGEYQNFSKAAITTFGTKGVGSGRISLSSTKCYSVKNVLLFSPRNGTGPPAVGHVIYARCGTCLIVRHIYAASGHGCTYWLHTSVLGKNHKGCEFIYDENCGSSPKYQLYDQSCQKLSL